MLVESWGPPLLGIGVRVDDAGNKGSLFLLWFNVATMFRSRPAYVVDGSRGAEAVGDIVSLNTSRGRSRGGGCGVAMSEVSKKDAFLVLLVVAVVSFASEFTRVSLLVMMPNPFDACRRWPSEWLALLRGMLSDSMYLRAKKKKVGVSVSGHYKSVSNKVVHWTTKVPYFTKKSTKIRHLVLVR